MPRFHASLLIAALLLSASPALPLGAQPSPRVIRPPGRDTPVVLWPGEFLWDSTSAPSSELEVAKLAYVQGFWDAITLMDAKAKALPQLSAQYDGMTVTQVVATMDKFYRENPQWRDYKPAVVLVTIIPRMRKGLPPVPPDTVGSPRRATP